MIVKNVNLQFKIVSFYCFLQIQTKRELFFKGETAPPSVPTVPPPQPPSAPSVTPTTTLTSSTAPPGAPAKSRLPPTTVTLNQTDGSEDSNKRENSRTESNKEANLNPHPRPTPPTKPKELDGYVGFANLPNQVYRKAVKKGFDFTLMVVGVYSYFQQFEFQSVGIAKVD